MAVYKDITLHFCRKNAGYCHLRFDTMKLKGGMEHGLFGQDEQGGRLYRDAA